MPVEAASEPADLPAVVQLVLEHVEPVEPGMGVKSRCSKVASLQVTRAAMIIHAYGHSTTETALATPRKEFFASL